VSIFAMRVGAFYYFTMVKELTSANPGRAKGKRAFRTCGAEQARYFFEWDEATTAAYFKRIPGAVGITIPKLVEMAAEQVELARKRHKFCSENGHPISGKFG
jgi:hypothetical protein